MQSAQDGLKSQGFWSIRSFRHGLTWVLCLISLGNTWSRNTLSMAMVCMVNATAVAIAKHKSVFNVTSTITSVEEEQFDGCGGSAADIAADYGGDIVWNSAQQGLLFSAIYWGGAIIGLPGGWLINRYGSKHIVSGCLLLTLIGTLTTPVAALDGGLWPTFFVRFVMGIGGQVVINTAITVIMSQWIPPAESPQYWRFTHQVCLALNTKRSNNQNFSRMYAGNQIAAIAGMPVNAALCRNRDFLGGWPSIFYVAGGIVLLSGVMWLVFVDDTPAQSRWISKSELHYIEKSLQSQSLGNRKAAMKNIPWRRILLSNALWCCVGTHFATGLVASTLQSYIPTYYKQALKIDLESNGLFSALPFLTQWISKMVFALAADAMKKHTRISHTTICKFFNTLGTIVASIFLIACAFMNCHQVTWAIVLLSLANGAFSGLIPGAMTALVCFAPAYTGVVNGLSRFVAQIASIVAPYIVGGVTKDGTPEQWRIVFYVMSGTMIAVGVYFLFCGTVKIQEWAKLGDVNGQMKNDPEFLRVPPDGNNNKSNESNAKCDQMTSGSQISRIDCNNQDSQFNADNSKVHDEALHL